MERRAKLGSARNTLSYHAVRLFRRTAHAVPVVPDDLVSLRLEVQDRPTRHRHRRFNAKKIAAPHNDTFTASMASFLDLLMFICASLQALTLRLSLSSQQAVVTLGNTCCEPLARQPSVGSQSRQVAPISPLAQVAGCSCRPRQPAVSRSHHR